MGYNPTSNFTATVFGDPAKAHAKLTALLKTKTISQVAQHYGVHRHTVTNWINRLVSQGYSDPRFAEDRTQVGCRPGTPGAYPRGGVK